MPPRSYNQNNPPIKADGTVAPIHVTSTITANDGTLGADGVKIKRKAWGVCDSDGDAICRRPISFIRVGTRCVYHSVRVMEMVPVPVDE